MLLQSYKNSLKIPSIIIGGIFSYKFSPKCAYRLIALSTYFLIVNSCKKIVEVLDVSCADLFAFDHIKPKEELVCEIISDIQNLKDREKIETIYKLIKATINE